MSVTVRALRDTGADTPAAIVEGPDTDGSSQILAVCTDGKLRLPAVAGRGDRSALALLEGWVVTAGHAETGADLEWSATAEGFLATIEEEEA